MVTLMIVLSLRGARGVQYHRVAAHERSHVGDVGQSIDLRYEGGGTLSAVLEAEDTHGERRWLRTLEKRRVGRLRASCGGDGRHCETAGEPDEQDDAEVRRESTLERRAEAIPRELERMTFHQWPDVPRGRRSTILSRGDVHRQNVDCTKSRGVTTTTRRSHRSTSVVSRTTP
jgi:hypothetical protein